MKLTKSQLRQIIKEEIQKLNTHHVEVIEEGFWKDLALLGFMSYGSWSAGGFAAQAVKSVMPAKIVQSITKDAAKNDMLGIEDDAQVLQNYIQKLADAFNKGQDMTKIVGLSDKEEIALSNIERSLENSPNPKAQKVLDLFTQVRQPVKGFKHRTAGAMPPGTQQRDANVAGMYADAAKNNLPKFGGGTFK